MFIAQLLFLVEPYILGKMIDGLLKNEYNWLYCFLGIMIFENYFIYRRMVYDTKVYTAIYNNVVLKYLKNSKDSDNSSKIARTEMANNLINFLEHDIHYYIMSIISLVGSLIFIFIGHPMAGFMSMACIIPISFIVYHFYKKISQSTRVSHTHYENKINIITEGGDDNIEAFFNRQRKLLVCNSTLQGKNWVSLISTRIIFLVLALIVFTHNNTNLTQGDSIAMYAYINQFLVSLMSLPVGVETFTRVKDVLNRIN
jgi:hypothetical protein